MKANWLPLSAAVALAISSVSASAVDFHGYARAGMQASARGGEVYCLGHGGGDGHIVGRLGDECDTYAELVLSQEVYNKANSKFTVNTLVAFATKEGTQDLQANSMQRTDNYGSNDPYFGQTSSMREVYAKYDTSSGYSIWAGKRYYQRKDIHIMDYYYLNNSGYGAGIEGIDIGAGNLNFAVTKDRFSDGYSNGLARNTYKIDARWNGIPVGFGNLDVAVLYALPWASDKEIKENKDKPRNSGAGITLDHYFATEGLNNHFVVQYGTNTFGYVGTIAGGNHFGDAKSAAGLTGVRVIDFGTYDAGNFGLGYALMWAHVDSDEYVGAGWENGKRSGWEYSIVLRPEYKWTDYTRTTLELGYNQEKTTSWVNHWADDNGDDSRLYKDPDAYKITLAQQFTPGKSFWSRPAIRFYVSYLGGDRFASSMRANSDGKKNYQVTIGTQMEAWW